MTKPDPMTSAQPASGANQFEVSSELAVSPEQAWRHAVDPAGVNSEFWPLLRMTFPRDLEDLTTGWQPGEVRFRSWLLLLGVFPVEYDDVVLVEVEPGRRFLERSSMGTQRLWEHERIIEPTSTGCRLTDRVRFVPRLSILGPLLRPVFRGVFRLRHRNLRARFSA